MVEPTTSVVPSSRSWSEQGAALTDVFSLVNGGPLYRLLARARMAGLDLRFVRRRVVAAIAVAWVPLLVLSVAEGSALGGVRVPFLMDIDAYARFIVALPMLLIAEVVVHRLLGNVVAQFRSRGVVCGAEVERFERAIASATRLRDSSVVEFALLVLVLVIGPWVWRNGTALHMDTWYATSRGTGADLTRAGNWLAWVSLPLFQFLLLRWFFRLTIWWRFLWHVSRLNLDLKAAHPDRACGLGFLGDSLFAFIPVQFAQSVVVAGLIASRVLSGAGSASDFGGEVVFLIVLVMAMTVVPLLFFSPQLFAARREGLARYDLLGSAYLAAFEAKWFGPVAPAGEPLVGSADIQSLADMAGSTDIVRGVWPFAFDWRVFIQLLLVTTLPFFPLVLTVIPFGELVRNVVGILL